MWKDPDKVLFTASLYGGGEVQFGYAKYGGGMSVGTNPIMARIVIPNQLVFGEYPEGWFVIGKERILIKIKSSFTDKDNFLPEWLLLECYRYHYLKLKNQC
jgi:hypothetical protein